MGAQVKLRALAADNAELRRELLALQQERATELSRTEQARRSADAARARQLEAAVPGSQGQQPPCGGPSLSRQATGDQVSGARLSKTFHDQLSNGNTSAHATCISVSSTRLALWAKHCLSNHPRSAAVFGCKQGAAARSGTHQICHQICSVT